MKLKKIDDGMVVHCSREDEAKTLIDWAYECGFAWWCDCSDKKDTYFSMFEGKTCYKFANGGISYGEYDYFKNKKRLFVIEFSSLLIPEEDVNTMEQKTMNTPGWIPVSERLPEIGQIVLVSQTYSRPHFEKETSVTIGMLVSRGENAAYWKFQYYRPDFRDKSILDNGIICPGGEYVKAWMPLPEPYIEEI